MKLSLTTKDFMAQLQTVTRVASTRSAVQALSGVMIEALQDAQTISLYATDMEIGLRVSTNAQIDHPGSAVLPARLLLEVVRTLPDEQTTLELHTTTQDVELRSGAAIFRLRTLRSEDFPRLPSPTDATKVVLPAKVFVETISQVSRSASKDETRPVLTAIQISASAGELRMVATDSYRLSVKETTLEQPIDGALDANVPARALQELVRIVQQLATDEVAVSLTDGQGVFETGDVLLTSRLIDGQFPNYRQLLPQSVEYELHIATAELVEVVRRMSLLAQKNTPLRLALKEGELTVSAETPDIGRASETMPVSFHGDPLEIGFNAEFLRDGLESVDSEELVLKLISPLRPGLIETPDSNGFVYLIMPIRLNT